VATAFFPAIEDSEGRPEFFGEAEENLPMVEMFTESIWQKQKQQNAKYYPYDKSSTVELYH